MASKAAKIESVGGEQQAGTSLGIFQVIKAVYSSDRYVWVSRTPENIKTFLLILKTAIGLIPIATETSDEIKRVIIPFTQIYLLYTRFAGVCKKLRLVCPSPTEAAEEYADCLHNCAWNYFILLRTRASRRSPQRQVRQQPAGQLPRAAERDELRAGRVGQSLRPARRAAVSRSARTS